MISMPKGTCNQGLEWLLSKKKKKGVEWLTNQVYLPV